MSYPAMTRRRKSQCMLLSVRNEIEKPENLSLRYSFSNSLKDCPKEVRGGARMCISFLDKSQINVFKHQKLAANHKNRYIQLVNLVLFFVWEEARIQAYSNLSFDIQINSPGPVSFFSPPEFPKDATLGVSAEVPGFKDTASFVY